MYRAYRLTRPERVRVVILGQDPYTEPGQADGLAFSVRRGVPVPRSLSAIFDGVSNDVTVWPGRRVNGDLAGWAEQGVLLLNAALTVEAHEPLSHVHDWSRFTHAVLRALNARNEPTVFILFGELAGRLVADVGIDESLHKVISLAHPAARNSALPSVEGSHAFRHANEFLMPHGRGAIDWGALP